MPDIRLVIQRLSDMHILCSKDDAEDGLSFEPQWFPLDIVQEEYGLMAICEEALIRMGYTTTKHQEEALPVIIAGCTHEYYGDNELRFLVLSQDEITGSPILLPRESYQ